MPTAVVGYGMLLLVFLPVLGGGWRRERGRPGVRPSTGIQPEQAERLAPHKPAPAGAPPE